jgi:hypothetical protein
MDDRADRIGFVAEDFDPEDGSRLMGTFSVHWESREHAEHEQGPQGVSAEEAIAWARRHATQVSVLLYDDASIYSAGEVPYTDLPPWPEAGMVLRPRPIGAPRDGSVQEIPWHLRSEVSGKASDEERARLAALIAEDPRAANVQVIGKRRRLLIELEYTASSVRPSCLAAHELIGAALARVLPGAVPLSTGSRS